MGQFFRVHTPFRGLRLIAAKRLAGFTLLPHDFVRSGELKIASALHRRIGRPFHAAFADFSGPDTRLFRFSSHHWGGSKQIETN